MTENFSGTWDETDDWAGIASAKERRRRQNRVHQRAYRRKRHFNRLELNQVEPVAENGNIVASAASHSNELWSRNLNLVKNLPLSTLLQRHEIYPQVLEFLQKAMENWSIRLPVLRDLPLVSRLNAFDALARNAFILNIPVDLIESDDGESPFFQVRPESVGERTRSFPPHLAPTALQTTVRHHPWLDLFPFPTMRDNILIGLDKGLFDEDWLAEALVCDFLDLTATTSAALVIWGDSWDLCGWEISPEFFCKWSFLLGGCQDLINATNTWRARRHMRQLDYQV